MDYRLDRLKEFLRIPSISADQSHRGDCLQAANFLTDELNSIGMTTVERLPSAGLPFIYAESSAKGPGENLDTNKPTLLVYGHYDVQPLGDENLWHTQGFDPAEKDGYLFARGIADDKGQIFSLIEGIRQAYADGRELKYNIKLLVEGEEEIGSPHVEKLVEENKAKLACDLVFISDSHMHPEQPLLLASLRGLVMYKLTVKNASQNIHSGMFGGLVANPAIELARLITGTINSEGEIQIPGFYDLVRELDPEVLEKLDDKGAIESTTKITGAKAFIKNPKYTAKQMMSIRPTMEINGFHSGCAIDSPSTIIPAEATALVSFRLVADQEQENIEPIIKNYFEKQLAEGFELEVESVGAYKPTLFDETSEEFSKIIKEYELACAGIWKNKPKVAYEGGSIGIVADFKDILGVPTLLSGFSYEDASLHGPNENMEITQLYKGAQMFMNFLLG
jgi:acetylornithine deacetylase/succinyl-diaminopimelate desuccinylase-like protein